MASKSGSFALGAVFFAALFATVWLGNYKPSVAIGSKDKVYYSGSATRVDAQSLGNALKASGYLMGQGVDVDLAKGSEGTVISFIVKVGSWDRPEMVANFEELGREVGPSVGGFPLRVRLLSNTRDIKKESTVGKVAFAGNDQVYYMGEASEAQAQALGNALTSQGFFVGRGADVFFSKHSGGAILSFVVARESWNNSAVVRTFEKIVQKAAPAVGGLPIRLRLTSPSLDIKKDEMVN